MKTYKFYLKASEHFCNKESCSLDKKEKEYYPISSLILSWIALESYVNAISDSLSKSSRLRSHVKKYLLEKEYAVNDDGKFIERSSRPSTTKKILFIIEHFSKMDAKKIKQRKIWRDIKSLEDLRNKIIHHKEKNDVNITRSKAIEMKNHVEDMMTLLNKEVFGRKI